MLRIAATMLMLSAWPAAAQDDAPPASDMERGADLLSDGARLLLRGLLDEVEPRMRELAEILEAWDWEGLSIDDLSNYHAPEMLPNGDIIIRRKTPRVPQGAGPEIDI